LQEHNNFNIPEYDGKVGIGINTPKNDRRLFVWVPIQVKDKEYLIDSDLPIMFITSRSYTKLELCIIHEAV